MFCGRETVQGRLLHAPNGPICPMRRVKPFSGGGLPTQVRSVVAVILRLLPAGCPVYRLCTHAQRSHQGLCGCG